jgi:hypothetical protein
MTTRDDLISPGPTRRAIAMALANGGAYPDPDEAPALFFDSYAIGYDPGDEGTLVALDPDRSHGYPGGN